MYSEGTPPDCYSGELLLVLLLLRVPHLQLSRAPSDLTGN